MEQYIRSESLLNDRLSNGFLLLPFFRTKLLFRNNDKPALSVENKKTSAIKRLRFLRYFSKFFLKDREILVISTTVLDVRGEDGRFFNILHGYYKNINPSKTLVVEDCDEQGKWNTPNVDIEVSYIITPLLFICKIASYIYCKFCKSGRIKADNLTKHYPQILSDKDIEYTNYYCIFTYKLFRFIFKHLSRLKLLVVNCGAYGAEFASMIKAAHDLGISVAEPQHGMINDIHQVYNLEDFTYNSVEYREYLPDYLLTFGQFWNDHSYIPVEKIIVGHPHLEKFRKEYFSKIVNDKKGLLFISQPAVFDSFVKITTELSEMGLKNITLRLHPFDELTRDVEKDLLSCNIKISDYRKPLYEEIASAQYVIGWTSTCLYEALGLGCSIMILEDADTLKMYTGKEGSFFNTADDILRVLDNDHNVIKTDNQEYYYASNFVNNYNAFLNKYIWK